jgi:hypothetical protein
MGQGRQVLAILIRVYQIYEKRVLHIFCGDGL